ncbi:winged helix-turn-helix transcriptional regulator [Halalkalibacter oceani]|uniref:Helix-turn-helix transcriptional regulator n=1 Tax=Halalkalibacter oceani TaxID=1653776 RepID=A0A9X2IP65_9BACI|nr:helix-turn-helix domain-containing protein [Halalkalibacter oceani]MCM3714127.1 helix-turn-helix transcriptional regulator [Halalkalibacter oceani]
MEKTKRSRRSDCPISYSLDLLGDSWSLLIIRDIVFADKKTFGEFLASDEGIARNILTNRLTTLTQKGILTKQPHPSDKRKDLYQLTEAGLDLIPILLDLSLWGAKHEPATSESQAWLANVQADKDTLVGLIRETLKEGGSVFTGPDSVMNKLERLGKMK